jgi:hypothetical protein
MYAMSLVKCRLTSQNYKRQLSRRTVAILGGLKSVKVTEKFEGQIAWDGTVEVFDLIGHPKARRAYAWFYSEGDQQRTVTVLHVPPVDSPQSAIKVAIASKARQP